MSSLPEGDALRHGLAALGIDPAAALTARFAAYLDLLERWNRAYNLTSVTDRGQMIVRHLLDSAAAKPYLAGTAILDAGSGAGLPGIPLALLEPARHFTLVDSSGKKVRFLRQVVMELALDNVTPVQARLERWQAPTPFDTVICRAFASLADFVAACAHLCAPAGRLVALKGRRPDAEVALLPAPWRPAEIRPLAVPGLDAERHVVVLVR
jgi:16S rRNA (guanine527-N7)-methyltransferase